jgi:ketosteroid isomerase-like protein
MRVTGIVIAGALLCAGTGEVRAQDAQAEKTIIANERAASDAFNKGDVKAFTAVVSTDGWAVDSAMGREPVANLVKDFAAITKELKISSWDISESKVQWVGATTAIHSYKWTGSGTDHGKPVQSPVWASTVWTKKDGKWMAVFHQESAAPTAAKP